MQMNTIQILITINSINHTFRPIINVKMNHKLCAKVQNITQIFNFCIRGVGTTRRHFAATLIVFV